jgi:hypothetical protein
VGALWRTLPSLTPKTTCSRVPTHRARSPMVRLIALGNEGGSQSPPHLSSSTFAKTTLLQLGRGIALSSQVAYQNSSSVVGLTGLSSRDRISNGSFQFELQALLNGCGFMRVASHLSPDPRVSRSSERRRWTRMLHKRPGRRLFCGAISDGLSSLGLPFIRSLSNGSLAPRLSFTIIL